MYVLCIVLNGIIQLVAVIIYIVFLIVNKFKHFPSVYDAGVIKGKKFT